MLVKKHLDTAIARLFIGSVADDKSRDDSIRPVDHVHGQLPAYNYYRLASVSIRGTVPRARLCLCHG